MSGNVYIQNRHVNMDIMMNKIVRVLEVLVRERDDVHDLAIYKPSNTLTERLDNLFMIVNDIESTETSDPTNITQGQTPPNTPQTPINDDESQDTGTVLPL